MTETREHEKRYRYILLLSPLLPCANEGTRADQLSLQSGRHMEQTCSQPAPETKLAQNSCRPLVCRINGTELRCWSYQLCCANRAKWTMKKQDDCILFPWPLPTLLVLNTLMASRQNHGKGTETLPKWGGGRQASADEMKWMKGIHPSVHKFWELVIFSEKVGKSIKRRGELP